MFLLQYDAMLRIKLTLADVTAGNVVLAENGIDIGNCGELYYNGGVPTEETNLASAGNCLKGSQRGFAYEMPISGNVVVNDEGFLWQPENGKLSIRLDLR